MTTAVKICGITRVEDGLAAARAGAHAVGIVFHPASPRWVDIRRAREIVERLLRGIDHPRDVDDVLLKYRGGRHRIVVEDDVDVGHVAFLDLVAFGLGNIRPVGCTV
jgi:hypothetical protein